MINIIGNKVAVVPIFDPDKIGRIYIPDQAKERCDQGIVKYIGPKVKDIRIGMYVVFSGYTGTLLNIEGEGQLIIMPEDFITAELVDPPQTEVAGVYFKGVDGDYFPANYEMVMSLVGQAFTNAPWFHRYGSNGKREFNVVSPRPKPEDYEKLR